MSGIMDRVRDRFASTVHAGALAKGKLSNTKVEKAKHFGYKIANSKIVAKIRTALDKFARKVRSQRLYLRRVSKFDAEVLKLVHSGKPININALKKLDLQKTERLADAYKVGIETVKESLGEVRKATAEERQRLTSLRETRAAEHRVKIAGVNHATLTDDAHFATSNRKMVHDYAMHLMLYEGVNNKGKTCTLAGHFKEARKTHEHNVNTERGKLSIERSERRLALEQAHKVVETDSEIQALDKKIAAIKVDDVAVLKDAMLAFQKNVLEYTDSYKSQIKQRRKMGKEGNRVLSPKPLINWKAASGQDVLNMLAHYTKPENNGELYAFRESHEEALKLPSSRYSLSQSPSEEIMNHIIEMEKLEEVRDADKLKAVDTSKINERAVAPMQTEQVDSNVSKTRTRKKKHSTPDDIAKTVTNSERPVP